MNDSLLKNLRFFTKATYNLLFLLDFFNEI